MRKTLVVCLLALLLTSPAVAGEMPNGSPTPPPPSQPSVAQEGYIPNESSTPQPASDVAEPTANGWMGNGAAASWAQVAFDLFAVWPSLL